MDHFNDPEADAENWNRWFPTDDSDEAADREMQEHADRYLGILDQPEVRDIAYSVGGLRRFWENEE